MQQVKLFTLDLTKVKGRGDFKCPKCGAKISPDDETENAYTILRTVVKGSSLDSITSQCNRCQSQISLTGFNLLKNIT